MKKKLYLNKTIILAIIFNCVQIAAVTSVVIYSYIYKGGEFSILSLFFLLIAFINCIFTIIDVNILRNNDMLRDSINQVGELNKTLRAQRHDFMNHLQVVYGLMEIEEYHEASEYIEKVFNDIQKVSRVLKTSNPAVNALLQAKVIFGEKRGINIKLNITTQLKDLKIPSWEFCRVLGNIIDNAIYSLQNIQEERIIEINVFEDLKNYGFKITNNGPEIPKEIRQKIFEVGFTTKGERGEGMGLAICKEILEQYGGSITVLSEEEWTTFEGFIPH